MDIVPEFLNEIHLSDDALESVRQRVLYEAEQIRMPTTLLKKTMAQIADTSRIRRYAMSGETLPPVEATAAFFSDAWIDHLVANRQEKMLGNIRESLHRLVRHKDELSRWCSATPDTIQNIQIADSETHNNGRSLLIYTFGDTSKIVYKPVCLRVVKLFGDVVGDVLGRDNTLIKVPHCYPAGEDYGFLEYLEKTKAVADKEALRRFYYRSGVVLSFVYALRVTDLHDGNLIASGEFPVVFDLETSFYQFPNDLDFRDIRDTGMIGNRRTSGIEGGGESLEWQPRIEHAVHGQPVLQYTQRVWFDDNRLYDKDKLADPSHYTDEVIAGFRYGYTSILKNKSKIGERLEQERQEGHMRVRHLVRHTAYYNLLLAWLRQPMVDPGTSRHEEILEDLYKNYTMDHPLSEDVYMAELNDLLRGDIPYFWTSFDSRDLECITGIVQKDYFEETSYQRALRHLDRMSIEDMENQAHIIHESMRGEDA